MSWTFPNGAVLFLAVFVLVRTGDNMCQVVVTRAFRFGKQPAFIEVALAVTS